MTKYHFSRAGTVAPCEATVNPCPLGGIHYDSKEEAQWEMMDLNMIRNHWRTGGMPGDAGWRCTCGWEPEDATFSGLAKVNAHSDEAHASEVAEAKVKFREAQLRQAPLLSAGQQVRITYLPDRTGEREVIGRLLNVQGALVVQPSYYKSDEFLTVVNSRGELSGNVRLHTVVDESASQLKVPADFVSAAERENSRDLPHAASAEAWGKLRRSPRFKLDLERYAMEGYRSYDASSVDQSIEEARSAMIRAYSKVGGELGARDAEVLLAHRGQLGEQLRPLIKQLYLVGYLEGEEDKRVREDEERSRAQARESYMERARIRRSHGI